MKKVILSLFVFIVVLCGLRNINAVKAETAASNIIAVGNVTSIIQLSGPTRHHFQIYFDKSIGTENATGLELDEKISSNIFINGKSVADINDNGVDRFNNKLKNSIKINVWDNGEKYYGLHIFIDAGLSSKFGINLSADNTLTISNNFQINGYTTNEIQEFTYSHKLKVWLDENYYVDNNSPRITYFSTIVEDFTQGFQYVFLKFKKPPTDRDITFADYDSLIDNLYINGKSMREINNSGVDKDGALVNEACVVHFNHSALLNEGEYGMFIFLQNELIDKYKFNPTGENIIEFRAGLELPSGAKFENAEVYKFYPTEKFWALEKSDEEKLENINILDISRVVEVPAVNPSYYVVLYFDKPISYQYMPHINASLDWLNAISKSDNPPFYYSYPHLQALITEKLQSSVLDKILFDGVSIRDLMAKENTFDPNQTIIINYTGDGFNPKALQINFSGDGVNKFNTQKEHTLTILKDFRTPLGGILDKTFNFKYNPETMLFKQDEENGKKSGCVATVLNNNVFEGIGATFLALFATLKHKKELL